MKYAFLAAAAIVGVAASASVHADEPLFGYIYTTDLLPKGKSEVEQWVTQREGRSQGTFHLWQSRTEVSYGVADNFQLSGYINLARTVVNGNVPDGSTAPPEVFADYRVPSEGSWDRNRFESGSVEAIYRFASPYTSPIGAAVYIEPSVGPRTRELETRLILQKNFLDDRLVFAFNTTVGQEKRYLLGDPDADPATIDYRDHWDKETDVNFGFAGSYRFTSNWFVAAEVQNEREWAGFNPFKADHRTNVAWYAGPTVHYAAQHFFATFTTLFQLHGARDYADGPDDSFVVHGQSNADDFEKYRYRLKVGYYF